MERDAERPLLVTGLHRTGTTWTGKLLASHPSLFYIHEPFHKRHAPGICPVRIPRWFQVVGTQNEDRYGPAVESTVSLRFSLGKHILSALSPNTSHFGDGLWGGVWGLKEWFRWTKARLKGARPLIKDPLALLAAEWFANRFNAQVTVLIRHPAGFVRSVSDLEWRHDFRELLRQRALREDLFADHVGEIESAIDNPGDLVDNATLLWKIMYDVVDDYRARHPDWTYVRMEDLAMHPHEQFSDLCDQLGIPFDDHVRRAVKEYTRAGRPSDEYGTYEVKRDSRSQAWRWKEELDRATVQRIQQQTTPVWENFYTPDEWE